MEKNSEMGSLKKKSIQSTIGLFFQSGYASLLGLVANLVLTILLSPATYGIYITTLSIISLLNYFSDIGMAASLIQRKDITREDVKTTFTVQQILIITAISIGSISTSFIKNFYHLPQEGVWLFWALLTAFFISSLKTIPSVFLERSIQFKKIAFVQIVENTVFYVTVIVCALMGLGLKSFIAGVLARAVVGLVLIYSLSWWTPTIGISIRSLKSLLSFGLPFQASSFLALFKDDLIILYLGKVLGFEGIGYIGWAKRWAEAPIRIIMDNISRVLFPVIARIQHDKDKVGRVIEKIIYYQTLLLAPTIAGMAIMIHNFVLLIPRYDKWEPALPLFYLFCLASFFSSYSTPFINLFNALGRAKTAFAFMLFWTVTTWILTPIFVHKFSLLGFPMVQVLLSLSFVIVMAKAKQLINFRFKSLVYKPILTVIFMGAVLLLVSMYISPSVFSFIGLIALGGIIYYSTLRIIFSIDLVTEVKSLFHYE